jgi:hypothetical protein
MSFSSFEPGRKMVSSEEVEILLGAGRELVVICQSARGRLRSGERVVGVTWSSTTAGSGTCAGTSSWRTPAIPLFIGTNIITIRATDAAGNIGWRAVMVTRY